jgi:hypothetical protein
MLTTDDFNHKANADMLICELLDIADLHQMPGRVIIRIKHHFDLTSNDAVIGKNREARFKETHCSLR